MGVLDILFPKYCLKCKRVGKYICENCLARAKKIKGICPVCEKPSIDGFTHIKCKTKYSLDGLVSIWEYEGVVRKAIISLKYKYATDVINELTPHILKVLRDKDLLVPNNYYLTPIPLHRLRENSRGFNQSYLFGKLISSKMRWKFTPNLLTRKKMSTPQAQLSGVKRRRNIKGVFVVDRGFSSLINNSSIILFDDVYTTGSTLKEAAKILKRSRVKNVWGLTIAR